MDKKAVGAIATLAAVTVVFLGAVHLKSPAARFVNKNAIDGETVNMDVEGHENIDKAVTVLDKDGSVKGYIVTVREEGFGGDIVMDVSFNAEASRVLGIHIVQQTETPDLGGRIAEEEFRAQFADTEAPVYLPSMLKEEQKEETGGLWTELLDGTYTVEAAEPANGYTDTLELTVEAGKVTRIVWDAVDEDGNRKSVLSEEGAYTMTEDGLIWKEQAEALAKAVIEHQGTEFLALNEEGKTDAVTGVSVSLKGFENLLKDALKLAAGSEPMVLADGVYEKEAEAGNGYTDVVTMTVEDGRITGLVWDSVDAEGNKKSVLSEEGAYTMTEDGLIWKEQAGALAKAVIENQGVDFLAVNEEGKTDAVSGVSVSVNGFVNLVQKCMEEAAGNPAEEEAEASAVLPDQGTVVDGVSGATVSSTAVVTGVNRAAEFLNSQK